MVIDEYGDRKPDYSISIYQGGQWKVLFEYTAEHESLQLITLEDLSWQGGATSPPKGAPLCGWQDELCPDNSSKYPDA